MTVPLLQRVLHGSAHGDVTVVSLRGELDIRDEAALQACLGDIRWQGRPRSVIDLTGLEFIDCACLSVLAGHVRNIRARGGTAVLAGPHGAVRRILAVTGLLTGLAVHDYAGQAAGDRVRQSVIFPSACEPALLPPRPERTMPRPDRQGARPGRQRITDKTAGDVAGHRRLTARRRTGRASASRARSA
jgi:anti-anti-sigma factor